MRGGQGGGDKGVGSGDRGGGEWGYRGGLGYEVGSLERLGREIVFFL